MIHSNSKTDKGAPKRDAFADLVYVVVNYQIEDSIFPARLIRTSTTAVP
jgi:hypothetical protein